MHTHIYIIYIYIYIYIYTYIYIYVIYVGIHQAEVKINNENRILCIYCMYCAQVCRFHIKIINVSVHIGCSSNP